MLCVMVQAGAKIHPAVYAAQVLLHDLKSLQKRMASAGRSFTVERVHQIRVATRRLRNALDIFASLLPEEHRKWIKRLKRVTQALGAARDLDVQLLWLRGLIVHWSANLADPHLPGAQRLELRLAQQRRALEPDLIRAVDRFTHSGVMESMHRSLKAMKNKKNAGRPVADFKADARRAIAGRLRELMSFERFVHSPHRVQEHHAMRISAKHLRYTLEAYEELLGSLTGKAAERVRGFQAVLGEMHDCDVWMETLPAFTLAERKRHSDFLGHVRGFSALERGLKALRTDRQLQRQRRHGDFVRLWDQSVRQGFWRRLGGVLPAPES